MSRYLFLSISVLVLIIKFIEVENQEPECKSFQFRCANGECINANYVCDRDYDCDDKSDELNCSSGCNGFRCGDGECIPPHWKCDGDEDCSDDSDELNCETQCEDNQFRCTNGECINANYLCDRNLDCFDNSDEINCTKPCSWSEFTCASGHCVPTLKKCDGHKDCSDGSDEVNCSKPSSFSIRPQTTEKFLDITPSDCNTNYCMNSGQCELVNNVKICRCTADYEGERCHILKNTSIAVNRSTTVSTSIKALLLSILRIMWIFRK